MRISSGARKPALMFIGKAGLLPASAARLKSFPAGASILIHKAGLLMRLGRLAVFLALAAAVLLAGPAAAEEEEDKKKKPSAAPGLETEIKGRIDEQNDLLDDYRSEERRLKGEIRRKCRSSQPGFETACSNSKKDLAQTEAKIKETEERIDKLEKYEKDELPAYQQQLEAHQDAVRKKTAKQARLLKLSATVTGAAAAYLGYKCAACSASCWPVCGLAIMAVKQTAETLEKKNDLDDFCKATGSGNCDPNPAPIPGDGDGDPNCESPFHHIRQAARCDSEGDENPSAPPNTENPNAPPPKPTKPSEEEESKLNNIFGCDPPCFKYTPGGNLTGNPVTIPDDLKDSTLAGGKKKVTSDDIMKRLSPKQKAQFAKAMSNFKAKHAGAIAEMEALTSADSEEDGEGEEEGEDSAGAGSGKIAGDSFQGGASSGSGGAGAAGGSSGGSSRGGGGDEEDSIDKQVQALLAKARGRRFGQKGKKGKGFAGKKVTAGGDQIGSIDENIFMMMSRRYHKLRINNEFVEERIRPAARKKTGNFILDAAGI